MKELVQGYTAIIKLGFKLTLDSQHSTLPSCQRVLGWDIHPGQSQEKRLLK